MNLTQTELSRYKDVLLAEDKDSVKRNSGSTDKRYVTFTKSLVKASNLKAYIY